MAAEHLGVSLDDAYKNIGLKMEDMFGSLYAGFEAAAEGGDKAISGTGIPKEWVTVLVDIAKTNIKIQRVKVSGILKLSSLKPNGVATIKEALILAKTIKKPSDVTINIYTIGAPRYKIEVEARDYKEGEKFLKDAASAAIASIEKEGGTGEFKRKNE
jgi:translation initiation factor 2 subunit 1